MKEETQTRFVIAPETEEKFGLEVYPSKDHKGIYINEIGWKKIPIYVSNEELPSLIATITMIKEGRSHDLAQIQKSAKKHP